MLSPLRRLSAAMFCLLAFTSLTGISHAQNVTTWHNDNNRTGWQQNEAVLTADQSKLGAVNQKKFGLLWQWTVNGPVYAQPLAVAGVQTNIQGCQPCDLVFISTEQDMLYAFNAAPSAQSNPLVWSRNLAAQVPNGAFVDCNNLNGLTFAPCSAPSLTGSPIGITGTPVIDTIVTPDTLFAVASVFISTGPSGPSISHYLFAVNITSGAVLAQTQITGNVSGQAPSQLCKTSTGQGQVLFDPTIHIQRSALLLLNDTVYVAFAPGSVPGSAERENGWMFGYTFNGSSFSQTAVFNSTPYGTGGGIWQAGAGPAAETRGGNSYIYAVTGNGTFDVAGVQNPSIDYGDSLLKLNPSTLAVLDYYTPYDVLTAGSQGLGRCKNDIDFASGGVLLFPEDFYLDQNTGTNPYLLVNADKESTLWVANRDNLGKFNSNANCTNNLNNIQCIYTPTQADAQQGYWSSPAYWKYKDQNSVNHYQLYYSVTDPNNLLAAPYALNEYQLLTAGSSGPIPSTYLSTANLFCPYSPTPSVSSNGTTARSGIVWAIENQNANNVPPTPNCNSTTTFEPAALHAFDATSVNSGELYSSRAVTTKIGGARGFPTPTIFQDQVYMGTTWGPLHNRPEVDVFGLCSTNVNNNGQCLP